MTHVTTGRSALFSPADRPDRAAKALAGEADLVILDLEDAVAPEAKDAARGELAATLRRAPERTGVVVRVNDPATPVGVADLAEVAALADNPGIPPLSVMIPKLALGTPLDKVPDRVPVIGLIETARAVRDLHAIAALPRVTRLALGGVDLAAELDCAPDSAILDVVRAQLVVASAAAGVAAPLDSPCVNFRDPEVVADAARRARRDGFGGLLCIHPAQLAAVVDAYRPTEGELAWARKMLAAGEAATAVDGEMVDRPVILRARRILSAAAV